MSSSEEVDVIIQEVLLSVIIMSKKYLAVICKVRITKFKGRDIRVFRVFRSFSEKFISLDILNQ